MSQVKIFPKATPGREAPTWTNPLPQLLHTPSGLAMLELQGTINLPEAMEDSTGETHIGRLVFPDYNPDLSGDSTAWMKRVYLYVGAHQRLTGEVKKLPKAIAIIRKRAKEDERGSSGVMSASMDTSMDIGEGEGLADELEVVEIVKWKILFSARPEPVGTWTGET
jgi:chromosome transmission fidelity protein 8